MITRKLRLALYLVLLPFFAVIFALPGSTNAQTETATPTPTVGTAAGESILTLPILTKGSGGIKTSIMLLDMSSKVKHQIAIPAGLFTRGAVLSPDGKWIAFTGYTRQEITSPIPVSHLYIIGTDGNHFQQLTTPSTQAEVISYVSLPAWSSDSQQLLFITADLKLANNKPVSVGGALTLLKWDGSKAPPQTTITPDIPVTYQFNEFVTWFPDNKAILFSAAPKANPGENDFSVVMSTGIDGKDTHPFGFSGARANWAPDGKKIAFISHNSIVITEADGSNSATVFKGDNTNSSFLIQVVWSPDGSQLLYSFNDGKSVTSLYVANTDGSNPVLLIQNNDTTGFGAFSWTAMSADAWAAISIGTPTPTVPPTRTPKPSATPKPSTTPKPSATLKATSTPQS